MTGSHTGHGKSPRLPAEINPVSPKWQARLHFPFPKCSLLPGLAPSRKSCLYYFRKIVGFFFLALPEARQMVSDFHAVSRVASETPP